MHEHLSRLNEAVAQLIRWPEVHSLIDDLKEQLQHSAEPFVWTTISLENTWYVIPEHTPHEFFPTAKDMVVVSFHTCDSEELEEVSCDSGATRVYA